MKQILASLGIAAIAGGIGYSLYQSSKPPVPQALWSDSCGGTPVDQKRVACINFPEGVRQWASAGLSAWVDTTRTVQLEYITVMLVEDDSDAATLATLTARVRHAAIFAYRELQERHYRKRYGDPPDGCIVYNSTAEVEGNPVDEMNCDARTVASLQGKEFVERHCIGFTVDGVNVMTLSHDVRGVLQATPSHLKSFASSSPPVDLGSLLRRCCVPSFASFQWHRQMLPSHLGSPSHSSSYNDRHRLLSFRSGDSVSETTDLLQRNSETLEYLWRYPIPLLFSQLGAILRFNRVEYGAFPDLLQHRVPQQSSPIVSRLLSCKKAVLSWAAVTSHQRQIHPMRWLQYCGRFIVFVELNEKPELAYCTPKWDYLVDHTTAAIMEVTGIMKPKSHSFLCMIQSPHRAQTAIAMDLKEAEAFCTVLQAEKLMSYFTGLIAVTVGNLGISSLVVVVPDDHIPNAVQVTGSPLEELAFSSMDKPHFTVAAESSPQAVWNAMESTLRDQRGGAARHGVATPQSTAVTLSRYVFGGSACGEPSS